MLGTNGTAVVRRGATLLLNKLRLPRCFVPSSQYRFLNDDNILKNSDVQKYLKVIEVEYANVKEENPVSSLLEQRKTVESKLSGVSSLSTEDDEEFKKLVDEEMSQFLRQIENINQKILHELLFHANEDRGIILEVTPGIGGREATLFAKEIFNMYASYSQFKNWTWTAMNYEQNDTHGIKFASAMITGKNVFAYMKQESGTHRVQRVPETESKGRIHTSTCSVAVLPQPTEIEINLPVKDLRFETKTSMGAGGQHVNKTETCVRVCHIPTGIVIENQTSRHQHINKALALERLRSKLFEIEVQQQTENSKNIRKEQIGMKMRSEKIRTYNYTHSRITDHRIACTVNNLPVFLLGGHQLNEMIVELIKHNKRQQILQLVAEKLQEQTRSKTKGNIRK